MEKLINLNSKCYRGGSYNGTPHKELALGGNDAQSIVGYNYNNYIISTFNFPSYFPDLNIIHINSAKLRFLCTDSTSEVGLVCQKIINGNPDTVGLFTLIKQSVINVDIGIEHLNLTGDNNFMFSTQKVATKQYLSQIQLIIDYRELNDWEIPDEHGKIDVPPIKPILISATGDVSPQIFESNIFGNYQVDERFIKNEIQLMVKSPGGVLNVVGEAQYESASFTLNTAVFGSKIVIGNEYVMRCRSRNYNGYSEWSDISPSFIKTDTPLIKLINVTGNNLSPVIESGTITHYMAHGNVNFICTLERVSLFNNLQLRIEHLYNGIWKTLDEFIAPTYSASSYTLTLDLNNERENGGLDSGERRTYRITCIRGQTKTYSGNVIIRKNKIPTFRICDTLSYYRIPLKNMKIPIHITAEDETPGIAEMTLSYTRNGTTYPLPNKLSQSYKLGVNDFKLDIANLFNNGTLKSGDLIRVEIQLIDSLGEYSEKKAHPTNFYINDSIPIPSFTEMKWINSLNINNNQNKKDLSIKWTKSQKSIFVDDILLYTVYYRIGSDQNYRILESNLTKNELLKIESELYELSNSITCFIGVTDGFDEVMSTGLAFPSYSKPSFSSNSLIQIKTVEDFISNSPSLITQNDNIPFKVCLSWPPIINQDSGTKYYLYLYNLTKASLMGSQLSNYVYNNSKNLNEAIIYFEDFNVDNGDEVDSMVIIAENSLGERSDIIVLP